MHIGMADSTNPEADALGYIRKYRVASLAFGVGHTFWRVSDRFAPHNAYSNTKELWTKQKTRWPKDFKVSGDFSWQFKDEVGKKDRGSAHEISLNWNGWGQTPWSVRWVYDPDQNNYKRFHNQEPHLDAVTSKQLTAKNVAVAFMQEAPANDGTARIVYDTIGGGKSLVFLDGKTIEGTWKKPSRMERTRFYDSDGQEVKFNRGKTWIMVVPENSEISY